MKFFINNLLIISFISISSYSYDIYPKSILYGNESSYLTNDYSPWRSNTIQTIFKSSNNDVISVKGESVEKYKLHDNRAEVSYFTPFFDDFLWEIDYSFAENGIIIPKNTLHNKITYNVKDLFGISYGLKNSNYTTDAKSQTQEIELEKYYSDFRFAVSRSYCDVKNAGDSTSNKITTHYFYNTHYTAIALSSGKELEALANSSVLISNVKSVSLYGEYSISQNWALGYSTEYVEQDDLYIRRSIYLAAIYKF